MKDEIFQLTFRTVTKRSELEALRNTSELLGCVETEIGEPFDDAGSGGGNGD